MSAFIDKLRAAGGGEIDRGSVVEVVIGHPHPLWEQMCDVIEAAAKLEWNARRGYPLWWPRARLRAALERLEASFSEPSR